MISVLLLVGCDEQIRRIDPFPVSIDLGTGAAVGGVSINDGEPLRVLVDTLSPVTIFDPGPGQPITRRRVDLRLYAVNPSGDPTVPRARFTGTESFDLHPCGDQEICTVGTTDSTLEIEGIVGFDVLGRSAVTFDFPRSAIEFSPDIAGQNQSRRQNCEAEFPGPFAGGGTLQLGDDDEPFPGRRPAVRACLGPGEGIESEQQGANALLIIATGYPITLISQAAYERFRAEFPGTPALSELPEEVIDLPSGRRSLNVGQVPQMAIVGQPRGERGACRELYANRVMAAGGCDQTAVGDCPCPDDNQQEVDFCRAGSVILMRRTIRVAIVPDEEPLLQALRDELRPGLPEVDGLLSPTDLVDLRVAFDYPNGRILMTCEVRGTCVTRPVVTSRSQARELQDVCPEDTGPLDAGIAD
ncbi:MAG: hypothetical protein KJO07_00185 [Deltaproteobacteria bacterium]|nr:hypothetical protein [Deltaproteobacteria bacterium]